MGRQLKDGTWANIITFADNYWLIATSAPMLQTMTKEWLSLLAEYGWETPTEELTWCTTWEDHNFARLQIGWGSLPEELR